MNISPFAFQSFAEKSTRDMPEVCRRITSHTDYCLGWSTWCICILSNYECGNEVL